MKDAYLTDEQFEKYVGGCPVRDHVRMAAMDAVIDGRPRGRCCVFFVAAQHACERCPGDNEDCHGKSGPLITFRNGQYWLVADQVTPTFCCGLPIHFCPWCGNYKP